jgi:hypothetical protein
LTRNLRSREQGVNKCLITLNWRKITNMVGLVTRLHTGLREESETDSRQVKYFSLRHRFQSVSAKQPSSYPRNEAGAWVWIFISI